MYKIKSPEIKYFENLPELNYVSPHQFKKGQVIFYKDHLPYGLFILISGEVEIFHSAKKSEIISEKALLGFEAFRRNKPYSLTAKASTDCSIYFISFSEFQFLKSKNSSLTLTITN